MQGNALSLKQVDVASKSDLVCDQLTDLTKRLGSGGRFPKVVELCEQLGVSWGTMNRALARLESRGLISRQHGRGIFVASEQKIRTIGVAMGIDPNAPGGSPFYGMCIRAVEREAARRGMLPRFVVEAPVPTVGATSRRQLASLLKSAGLSGALLLPSAGSYLPMLTRARVPTVSSPIETADGYGVNLDLVSLTRMGIDALVNRGCRRVALISDYASASEVHDHAHRLGVEFRDDWNYYPVDSSTPRDVPSPFEEHGYRCAQRIWADYRPDGIVVADDFMARGALHALERAGAPMNSTLHLAALSNKGSSVLWSFEHLLWRLEFDSEQLVVRMFDMLETLMSGGTPPRRIDLVEPRLVPPGGGPLRSTNS